MRKKYIFSALTLLIMHLNTLPGVSLWNGTINSDWGDGTNWTPNNIPTSPGDEADFVTVANNSITLTSGGGTVPYPPSVGILTFLPGASNYTISSPLNAILSLDNGSLSTTLTVQSGTQTISAPIEINSNAVFTIDGTLNLSNTTTVTGSTTLNLEGTGSFSNAGTFTDTNGATISVATLTNTGAFLNNSTSDISMSGTNVTNGHSSLDTNVTFGNNLATEIAVSGGIITNQNGAFFGYGSEINVINPTTVYNLNQSTFGGNGTQLFFTGTLTNDNSSFAPQAVNLTIETGSTVHNQNGAQLGTGVTGLFFLVDCTVSVTNGSSIGRNATGGLNLNERAVLNIDATSTAGPTPLGFISGGNTVNNNGTFYLDSTNPSYALTLFGNTITGSGKFVAQPNPNYRIYNSNGTIIPGGFTSGGTLSFIGGNYIGALGDLQINVGDGTIGQLVVNTADITGTGLVVVALPNLTFTSNNGFAPILIADGGVTGSFSFVDFLNFPSDIHPQLIYDPTAVYLNFTPLLTQYVSLYSTMILTAVNQVNYYLFKRLNWIKESYFCTGACNPCTKNVLNFYATPIGTIGHVNSRSNNVGFTHNSQGGLIGFEYILPRSAIGVEVDYERKHGRNKNLLQVVDDDHLHFNLYATVAPKRDLSFSLLLGGGEDWLRFQRTPLTDIRVTGRTQATLFDALLGTNYTFSQYNVPCFPSKLEFTPLFAIQYMRMNIGQFSERGPGIFGNTFDEQRLNSFRTLLGFNGDWNVVKGNWTIGRSINFVWQREFHNVYRSLTFVNTATRFAQSIYIPRGQKNIYLAGADVSVYYCNRFGIDIGYEFEGNQNYSDHFFTLTFEAAF